VTDSVTPALTWPFAFLKTQVNIEAKSFAAVNTSKGYYFLRVIIFSPQELMDYDSAENN